MNSKLSLWLSRHKRSIALKSALIIALIYAVIASLWVIGSDRLTAQIFFFENFVVAQTFKGLLFVGVTSVVLFFILWRQFGRYHMTEEMLKQREREFRTLVENSTDFIVRFDRELRHLYVNPSLIRALDISEERYTGRTNRELGVPEDKVQVWDKEIRSVFETGKARVIEFEYPTVDGLRCFQAQLIPEFADDGTVQTVLSMVRDITDLTQTTQALRTSEEKYRALVEQSLTGIYIVRRDKYLYVNQRFTEMFGYTEEEILNDLHPLDTIYEEDRDIVIANKNRRLSGEVDSVHYTVRGLKKDGTLIWIEIHGSRINLAGESVFAGTMLDITETKRAIEAQRESDKRLQMVIANLPVLVFEMNHEGIFQMLYGGGLEPFGVEAGDLLGESIAPEYSQLFEEVLDGIKGPDSPKEFSRIQQFGDRYLNVHYIPQFNQQGQVSIIGIATDISERLEAEMLRLEVEQERELVALKERFIATASHDFRTPLTIIKMHATMLENYAEKISNEQRHEKLHEIQTQVDSMTNLLDDVLTVSKSNAGKIKLSPDEIDLKTFCRQIWEDFTNLAGSQRQIDFRYDTPVEQITADSQILHQILVNLLSNAIKYTPDDGKILFEISSKAGEVIFRIKDSGIGIPVQEQKRLYEPFHRAANARDFEGTGLGLVIVKNYVTLHGGSIKCESEEGIGTTFTVTLPLTTNTETA